MQTATCYAKAVCRYYRKTILINAPGFIGDQSLASSPSSVFSGCLGGCIGWALAS